ncbi:DUF397 domain-containing protein [Kitasatospora sp. NPDC127067]|uniref:DUF397 domain-containing protein n=1 Tax=Kitasatospora sp. NPDC127067 TaxID=3347126 RepID=UPI0036462357
MLTWRKSSCSSNGEQCMQVSDSMPGIAPVRDSKEPEGPAPAIPVDAWSSFVAAVRSGELDRFAGHVEDLWANGREVWTTRATEVADHVQA